MPNRSSNAMHRPLRTCVVCRTKTEKSNLMRFCLIKDKPVFDIEQNVQLRGMYVCDDNDCLKNLGLFLKRRKKSRKFRS
jgi:hypothetical protein